MKLAKTVNGSVSSPVTTEYAGNYIYNKVSGRGVSVNLAFFNHPEGYVSNDSGSLNYVYQYKDHFEGGAFIKGMVYLFSERASWRVGKRVSYTDANKDGIVTASTEIVEEIDEGDSPNTKINKER